MTGTNIEYVDGIINSAQFRPRQKGYISKISENGIVEINFPWSDEGYGIVVKTTGRNERETRVIAEKLVTIVARSIEIGERLLHTMIL